MSSKTLLKRWFLYPYGYGAKKIISQMRKDGKKPASRAVIRRMVNTYDTILQTAGEKETAEYANS